MIIQTGMRTDIPAFYAPWFANRLKEGVVCTRNPYNRSRVTRYRLSPDVVDLIVFCTKNPQPMFPYLPLLEPYGQYWYVTITPYGKEIEPNVPDKERVLFSFRELSDQIGSDRIGWRYDPIFLSKTYTIQRHILEFSHMAEALEGATHTCVISFIDLYAKVKQNFRQVEEVKKEDQIALGRELIRIASEHGMTVKTCAEGETLADYGADCAGCMTRELYEKAAGVRLLAPKQKSQRPECGCLLGKDIGAYDTCLHLCRYCYANANREAVMRNAAAHDKKSPFLTGNYEEGDVVCEAKQKSWADRQISLFDL